MQLTSCLSQRSRDGAHPFDCGNATCMHSKAIVVIVITIIIIIASKELGVRERGGATKDELSLATSAPDGLLQMQPLLLFFSIEILRHKVFHPASQFWRKTDRARRRPGLRTLEVLLWKTRLIFIMVIITMPGMAL